MGRSKTERMERVHKDHLPVRLVSSSRVRASSSALRTMQSFFLCLPDILNSHLRVRMAILGAYFHLATKVRILEA